MTPDPRTLYIERLAERRAEIAHQEQRHRRLARSVRQVHMRPRVVRSIAAVLLRRNNQDGLTQNHVAPA